MKKLYVVEVIMAEEPYKHLEFASADSELEAIDRVAEHYKTVLNKEFIDIKVV